jgi:hypothetical protein
MTTLKATITFEISEKHLEALSNIQSKDVQELTQEDLLDLRTVLQKSLVWEAHKDEDKAYKEGFEALANMIGNERLFRPMDQRSLPEFALHHLLKWLDGLDVKTISVNAGENFYDALGDDHTVSYNNIQAQNYIRAFWDDFIEEDCEDWDVAQILRQPATFLDHQVGIMAGRLVPAIFKETQQDDDYIPLDEFKRIVSQMSASDLWDLVD